ncbi:hypothetical protein C8J56DRAFT_1165868 [Mycena floridula]|nr:hypothetical protein C8J56DRAFT_1165868 [Mycena floridula]
MVLLETLAALVRLIAPLGLLLPAFSTTFYLHFIPNDKLARLNLHRPSLPQRRPRLLVLFGAKDAGGRRWEGAGMRAPYGYGDDGDSFFGDDSFDDSVTDVKTKE